MGESDGGATGNLQSLGPSLQLPHDLRRFTADLFLQLESRKPARGIGQTHLQAFCGEFWGPAIGG